MFAETRSSSHHHRFSIADREFNQLIYGSEGGFCKSHPCSFHPLVMTSFVSERVQLGKRCTASLPGVAFSVAALIGGATVLSGGQAKAFTCSFVHGGATTCPLNQWIDSNPASDKLIKILSLPSTGSGDIEFQYIDNPPPGFTTFDQWPVDLDFTPNLMPLDGPSTFNYLIKIDPTKSLMVFKDISLSGGAIGDAKLTKEIWSTDASGAPLTLLHTLQFDPSNSIFDMHYDLVGNYNQLYIKDVADPGTFAGGGTVDNLQNTFRQVPGPLPILGAGAAFGYTRKLRRRLKATRLA